MGPRWGCGHVAFGAFRAGVVIFADICLCHLGRERLASWQRTQWL